MQYDLFRKGKPYKPQTINKIWGHEVIIANSLYCGKMLVLKQDYRCSIHMHESKEETFYFLDGLCLLEWEDKYLNKTVQYKMRPGICLTLEPNTFHRFSGIASMTRIIEISTIDLPNDSYRNTNSEYVEGGHLTWEKSEYYQL